MAMYNTRMILRLSVCFSLAGTRKLPGMKNRTSGRKVALYHDDGTVNLQALAHLGKRQSFPRTQSYYDRLERIRSQVQPPPAAKKSDQDNWVPLQLVDDSQLTPRRRAERDSFLATLLKVDDLTDEELSEIAHYFILDDLEEEEEEEEEESTPQSCLKKSWRPKTAGRKKTKCQARPKSVRFLPASSLPLAEAIGSPRPRSSPSPRSDPKPSDPFHVASPLPSPRPLDSPDEVAYFPRIESPPQVPVSPELIPEPEVIYAGEEIEEERACDDQASREENGEGEAPRSQEERARDVQASSEEKGEGVAPGSQEPFPLSAGSPRSESSKCSTSPASEPDPPTHVPEPADTPRIDRETVATQSTPRCESPSSSTSDSPRQQGLYGSSQSSRHSSPPQPPSQGPRQRETSPRSVGKARADSPATEESSPRLSTWQRPDSSAESAVSPSSPTSAHTEFTPNKDSSRPSEKLRPKSSKRKKSSPECLSKLTAQDNLAAPQERPETDTSPRPEQSEDASRDSQASPDYAPSVKQEPLPIPVISVTRGQLSPVPLRPRSPLAQSSDTQPLDSAEYEPQDNYTTESVRAEVSPLPNVMRGAGTSSPMNCSHSSQEKGRRKNKDERMKIWLTRTSWDRHVECVE